MNYSTEKDDYLMTTPYTKKIQQKFEKVKSFLEQNGFNPSSESLMQDIVSSEESVSYTHLRAHETTLHLVCRLLLEKKNIIT